MEVTGPVITSRRVYGSSSLSSSARQGRRDIAMRFVQPSRLLPSRQCHHRRDVDHCYSRLHRKLDYGVLRAALIPVRADADADDDVALCSSAEAERMYLPLLLSVAHLPVLISPPDPPDLAPDCDTQAAAFSACIQMHRATTRFRNVMTATSKIPPPPVPDPFFPIFSWLNLGR